MTTKELLQTISQKTGFSPEKAREALLAFQKILEDALKKGEPLKIRNFGTFYTRFLQSKPIPLNFKKGSPRKLRIPKKSVGFKVSHAFKSALKESRFNPRSVSVGGSDFGGTSSHPQFDLNELAQNYPGFRLLKSLINIARRFGGRVLHLMSVGNPPAGGKTLVKIRKGEHLTSLGEFSQELFKRIVSDLKKILAPESQSIDLLLGKAPDASPMFLRRFGRSDDSPMLRYGVRECRTPSENPDSLASGQSEPRLHDVGAVGIPTPQGRRDKTQIRAEIVTKGEGTPQIIIHFEPSRPSFKISQPFPRSFYLSLKDAFNQTSGVILVSSLRQGDKLQLAKALIEEYGDDNKVAVLTDGLELYLSSSHQNFDLRDKKQTLSQILPLIKRKGFKILLIDLILILPDLKKLLKKARNHLLVFTLVAQTPEEALQKFQKFGKNPEVPILSLSIKTAESTPEITCYLKETEEKDLASFPSKVLNS